jgi:methionyl-tRNA formyltransferase
MAPKVTVDDVRVDWSAPALRVDRLVRAATPAPGAWTTFRGKRIKLDPVSPSDGQLDPGVIEDRGKAGIAVGTATHPVLLGRVRPEGKPAMDARDWARGIRPAPGDRFE